MAKYKNTLQKGSVRYIIFKEGDSWYGVALEFNLVEEGDNPEKVMFFLFEAIKGYVKTARKFKMRPFALNQKPDKEYEELWNALEEKRIPKKTEINEKAIDQKEVFNFGHQLLNFPAPTH